MNTAQPLQQPHSIDAEQALIGSILIDPDAMLEVDHYVVPELFYHARHRHIWEALAALHARREPLDLIAIADELVKMDRLEPAGGRGYLVDLMNAVPTSVNVEVYGAIVAEKAVRRRLIEGAGKVAQAAYDEATPFDDLMDTVDKLAYVNRPDGGQAAVQSPRRYTTGYIDAFMADVAAGAQQRGIRSGLTDLDKLLGGLEAPHQYVLAGRPGMGKSSLALAILLDAVLRQGKRALMFSLEMSEKQLVNRLVSMMTNLPLARVRQPWTLSSQEQAMVMNAVGRLSDSGLYLDCTPGIKPADVRSRATRLYAEHGLDLVVVDHMHLMAPDKQTNSRVLDLGDISLQLANTYKQLGVVGLTVAQLSRNVESRTIKRPMLSDLRESGQIEENAYAVLFVYREHYYDPTADEHTAEVILSKHRDGETGQVSVWWQPELATFRNAATVDLNLPAPRANGHGANGHAQPQPVVLGGFA